MEWVETTAKTLEEAKDLALDELGVDDEDAEFEVLEEPRTGLFGRTRGEARVRARVRPTAPRAKNDRRDRRRRKADAPAADAPAKDEASASDAPKAGNTDGPSSASAPARPSRSKAKAKAKAKAAPVARAAAAASAGDDHEDPAPNNRRRKATPAAAQPAPASAEPRRRAGREEGNDMSGDATVEQQAAIITTFLDGLVTSFGYDATIAEERIDEETIELQVNGSDLGLLVGPKGQTLQAIQELSRTVVQRQATGTHHGRVRLDVAGYRTRRREALERFTRQVADSVLAEGTAKALEPMHPADRKIVHDTVNTIDGVRTISEGEDHRRRVVILPDEPATDDED